MYDKPKRYDGKLDPYPHSELGVEVSLKKKTLGSLFDNTPLQGSFLSAGGWGGALRAFLVPGFSSCSYLMRFFFNSYFYFPIHQRGRAKDPVGYLQGTEQRARERQVAYETVKLLRQRVIECYRREGVNHYENCKEVATDYYNTITKKDMGQLHPNWEKPEMKDGW